MRCRHRPGRWQGDAGGAGSREPVPGPARRPAPAGIATTTSSPTCCKRACWTSSPTRVPDLHRRASEWYEQNGERSEAIRHALAAEDFERAADLVELADPGDAADSTGGHPAPAGSRRFPSELFRVRPVLGGGICRRAAWLLVSSTASRPSSRPPNGGWTRRKTGERQVPRRPRCSSWTMRNSSVCRARSPCTALPWRTCVATWPATLAHARRALDLVPEDDHLGRGAAAALARPRVLVDRRPRRSLPLVRGWP